MAFKTGSLKLELIFAVLGVFAWCGQTRAQKYEFPAVRYQGGQLEYMPDSLGNRIPDYSYCGYCLSEKPVPLVPARVFVPAVAEDATSFIQNAIDYVSSLPVQPDGFRGAVLLGEGVFRLNGRLQIAASGVVLRGSGNKTRLIAGGESRETLIRIAGINDKKTDIPVKIISSYVPVGAFKFEVESTSGLNPGDQVIIHRPSTPKWIQKMKMEEFGGESSWLGWKPGERDIYWERTVKEIKGKTLILDAPLPASIDSAFGGGTIATFTWPGRISNVGIENFVLESEFDPSNPKDENHCWFAVTMENVSNAWVRRMNFSHFAGSAVALYETAKQVTVEDCISEEPVSEIAGQRRNTFFTMGQQTLFLRCYAENGYHDFSTGFCAAGPNAFVQCKSELPFSFSGAADSWATGVLFDIVDVDGQALCFSNRGQDGQGAGWTAANSMFWQCSAARIECFCPPTAQNYAYGVWAQYAGDGLWYEADSHIAPRSLFFAQLAERLGKSFHDFDNEIMDVSTESTSAPTIEQASEMSKQSYRSPMQLKDFISATPAREPISAEKGNAPSVFDIPAKRKYPKAEPDPSEIKNGWLVQNSKVLTGLRFDEPWWRGNPRPFEALKANPALTRFVPGRYGAGFTDDLKQVVKIMDENGIVAFHHNYGLWYDRRRDDHERIRRIDGDVWAPFYEQPFSRSGQGEAWDRLSRYDLTKYNPWYWSRLNQFARLAEEKGKILIHQNYFQHNILEAGAHWADFPWRPANNINDTGFPEPPPYSGDKRIYMAGQFYDVANPARRELHRAYIRQCLDNFKGQSNVIQSIGFEFTGPLSFVQFWFDVIAEWEKETGQKAKVVLSTTKDVQDSILADPVRSQLADIIDIRYWAYRADGSLYAPEGGRQMAPRQHSRKINPGSRSFEQVYRAVSEYRMKYPGKAVIYSEGNYTDFGWAIFMAGGSLAPIGVKLPDDFLKAASAMQPVAVASHQKDCFMLADDGEAMILFRKGPSGPVKLALDSFKGKLKARFLNPYSGKYFEKEAILEGGNDSELEVPYPSDILILITKNL